MLLFIATPLEDHALAIYHVYLSKFFILNHCQNRKLNPADAHAAARIEKNLWPIGSRFSNAISICVDSILLIAKLWSGILLCLSVRAPLPRIPWVQ